MSDVGDPPEVRAIEKLRDEIERLALDETRPLIERLEAVAARMERIAEHMETLLKIGFAVPPDPKVDGRPA